MSLTQQPRSTRDLHKFPTAQLFVLGKTSVLFFSPSFCNHILVLRTGRHRRQLRSSSEVVVSSVRYRDENLEIIFLAKVAKTFSLIHSSTRKSRRANRTHIDLSLRLEARPPLRCWKPRD
jgi:hypothetical protein